MGDVRARPDAVWMAWAKGHVSGTAGIGNERNMTGTLDEASNLNIVVTYPSGNVPSLGNVSVPSGTVLLGFPIGADHLGARDDRFAQTGYWHVTMEASGTDRKSNALATAQNYRVVQVAHLSVSGTYAFAFQRLSGSANAASGFSLDSDPTFTSASFQFEVPQDLANPSSMACEWSALFVGRKTSRRQ